MLAVHTPQPEPVQGLPAGGAAGQVLTKASAADYDAAWTTPAAGGGAPVPNVFIWRPSATSTGMASGLGGTVSLFGSSSFFVGSVATTNAVTRRMRMHLQHIGNNVQAGLVNLAFMLIRNNLIGGFHCSIEFGLQDTSVTAQSFIGVGPAAAFLGSPATLTNVVGVGHEPGQSSWSIYYGGTSPKTPIPLGADFPVDATSVMRIELSTPTDQSGVVKYKVTRTALNGAVFVAEGTLGPHTGGVDLPAPTVFLAPRVQRNTGTGAGGQITLAIMSIDGSVY